MTDWDLLRSQVRSHLLSYSVKLSSVGNEYTLASGGKSLLYVNAKNTFLHRSMHGVLSPLLLRATKIFGPSVDTVAGAAIGGCHLASLTASAGYFDVAYVRKAEKDHGMKGKIVGSWRPRFHNAVVLIEDVLSTGKSAEAAVQALEESLYTVAGIVALVDRRTATQGEDVAGKKVVPIFTLQDLGITEKQAEIRVTKEEP